jgi:hypothetical protein
MLSAFLIAILLLTGCAPAGIPLAYDSMIPEGGIQDNGQYNKDLFYRNDALWAQPDPFILYITDEDSTEYGYFYLYATNWNDKGYKTYRSKDLVYWQDVAPEVGTYCFQEQETDAFNPPYWAPEMIYDDQTDQYYLFYSAATTDGYSGGFTEEMRIGVATADEPYGPFLGSKNNILIKDDQANAAVTEADRGSWECIDPSPFIGADGEKYMLFTREKDSYNGIQITETGVNSAIWVVRITDWMTPDYATLTRLTAPLPSVS